MEYQKRTWDDKPKPALIIKGHELAMVDGTSPDSYIAQWVHICDIKDGEPVVMMPLTQYEEMRTAYILRGVA